MRETNEGCELTSDLLFTSSTRATDLDSVGRLNADISKQDIWPSVLFTHPHTSHLRLFTNCVINHYALRPCLPASFPCFLISCPSRLTSCLLFRRSHQVPDCVVLKSHPVKTDVLTVSPRARVSNPMMKSY